LSADGDARTMTGDSETTAENALDELLGEELHRLVGREGPAATAEDLLLEAELVIRGQKKIRSPDDGGETLGWVGMAVHRLAGVNRVEALRRALLDWLEGDRTFDLEFRDSSFKRICERIGPEVDFVVTGHTHLERAIRIDGETGPFYYNSGTWMRLIGLTHSLLKQEKAFRQVFQVLAGGSLEALDSAKVNGAPLILDRTSTVRIAAEGESVVGQLLRVIDGAGDTVDLKLVPKTEFRQ